MAKQDKKKGHPFRSLLLILLALFLLAGYMAYAMTRPVQLAETRTMEVPKSASTGQIAALLAEKDLVRNADVFKLYSRLKGFDGRYKTGSYTFNGTVSLADIAAELLRGKTAEIKFTVPEGLTLAEIAAILADKGLADRDRFLDVAQNEAFSYDYLPAAGSDHRLEGFLFPDTYQVPSGYGEKQIIEMMLKRFDTVMTPEWRQQAEKLKMSIPQVVTLASIIEREARVAVDRPLVSSVFHNRLAIEMRLESCATVQFALGKVKDVLLYEDLEIESPYNTYRNSGLPPGPIAVPGAASLEAALYPADTDFLFFVAKPDGSHYFSKTLAEHNAAKEKYLK